MLVADLPRAPQQCVDTEGVRCVADLFGDYVTWFTVAAITRRALFIDWTDSASVNGTSAVSGDHTHGERTSNITTTTVCQRSRIGVACARVPNRFDLGLYFGLGGQLGARSASWRWSRRARARVVAKHGLAVERDGLILARAPPDPIACSELTSTLSSALPWVTVSVADTSAIAMIPLCRTRAGARVLTMRRGRQCE